MPRSNSLLSDGIWISVTRGIGAAGRLFGLRLLTEVLPPETYGIANLFIGVTALLATGIVNPTMQAVLRYYPEFHRQGEGYLLRAAAWRQISRILIWAAPLIAAAGAAAVWFGWATAIQLLLIALLVVVDMGRTEGFVLLNSVRSHRIYGLWSLLEPWCRPLSAIVLVSYFGVSVEAVLAGFLMASASILFMMRRYLPTDEIVVSDKQNMAELSCRIWQYTLPLLPLGLLGWVSGMGDRYLIATLLTPADVGRYAAVYGLASSPMLMMGSVAELIIRPRYYQALTGKDTGQMIGYLKRWLSLILVGCLIALLITILGHEYIVGLLLGEAYRGVSYLLPTIVAGYSFLVLSQITTRVCYAHGKTDDVLRIEIWGAIAAVAVGFLLILYQGLVGAVNAIPIYFGIQLMVSARKAWPLLRQYIATNL